MDERTRSALMAAAWQALERNEGWKGSKEDFAKFWYFYARQMETAMQDKIYEIKAHEFREAVSKYMEKDLKNLLQIIYDERDKTAYYRSQCIVTAVCMTVGFLIGTVLPHIF